MSLIPAHDIVRLTKASVPDTADAVEQYWQDGVQRFNYQPARRALRQVAGRPGVEFLLSSKEHIIKVTRGATQNEEALRLALSHLGAQQFHASAPKPVVLSIRHNYGVKLQADLLIARGDARTIFWMDPRKGSGLNLSQARLMAGFLYRAYLETNPLFREFAVEVLLLGAKEDHPKASRHVQSRVFEPAMLPDDRELENLCDTFLAAIEELIVRGFTKPEKQRQTHHNDDQLTLFSE